MIAPTRMTSEPPTPRPPLSETAFVATEPVSAPGTRADEPSPFSEWMELFASSSAPEPGPADPAPFPDPEPPPAADPPPPAAPPPAPPDPPEPPEPPDPAPP